MLRTTLLSAACLAIALPASAETKTYNMGAFSELDVAAGVTVIFEAGDHQSIVAENDKGNFDKLHIETHGDTLVIKRKSSGWFNRNRAHYTVRLTGPAVSSIDVSSGAHVSATGIRGNDVQLGVSSGATLKASSIQTPNLELDASSGSNLEASGTCTSVEIDTSSGASIDARDVVCVNVQADASSGSSIRAHASQSVDGNASSGASIKVSGGATQVEKSRSSGGSVTVS